MSEESLPTKKQTLAEKVVELEQTVVRLEAALSRVAVMSGQGNVLGEYGIKRWTPDKRHMGKYRG